MQHDHRRGDDAEDRDDREDAAERAGDRVDQLADLVGAALGAIFGHDRHEGLRERALGEQPAQQVRDLVRENVDLEHDRGNDAPRTPSRGPAR